MIGEGGAVIGGGAIERGVSIGGEHLVCKARTRTSSAMLDDDDP